MASAVKTVDTAFSQYHAGLMDLRKDTRTDSARTTIETADKLLKVLRQNAVKAIHATNTCKKDDEDKADQKGQHEDADENDEDNEDEDEDDDDKVTPSATPSATPTASPSPTPSATPSATPTATATPAPSATTSTDPKTIADNAVAAMKLVFDTAKAELPVSTATPRPSRSPELPKPDEKGKKGQHRD